MHRHRRHAEDLPTKVGGKIGKLPIAASLGLHALLMILAWLLVWQTPAHPLKEKTVDFMPAGGGGGHPEAEDRSMRKQHRDFAVRQMERLAAKGVEGPIALPEAFASAPLQPLHELQSASLSKGQGGKGGGGGRGVGIGRGYGAGGGPGSGPGSGKTNPFGMLEEPSSALAGTFYDLKKGKHGLQLNTSLYDYHRIVHEFAMGDWSEKQLESFYQAPRKLYLTHLYMPVARAERAPSAFGQTPAAQPAWLVIYRGKVTAPKSGKFRFVGAGDDTLVVRFNGKIVFDHGYFNATDPGAPQLRQPVRRIPGQRLTAPAPQQEPAPLPKAPPEKMYRYSTTRDWNKYLGGMAVGSEFETVAGQTYPVEILISEGQGSLFAAALLIEESGATAARTRDGFPILPLFRTDITSPSPTESDNAPPYDANGPAWRVVKDREDI